MIGLPPGVGLDVSIWGAQGQRSAHLELVQYHSVKGKSLFNRETYRIVGYILCASSAQTQKKSKTLDGHFRAK